MVGEYKLIFGRWFPGVGYHFFGFLIDDSFPCPNSYDLILFTS